MFWTNHTNVSFHDYFSPPVSFSTDPTLGWNIPFECDSDTCVQQFLNTFQTWTTNTNVWTNAHVYGMLYYEACHDCDPIVLFRHINGSHPHRIVQDIPCNDRHLRLIASVAQDIAEQTGLAPLEKMKDLVIWGHQQPAILHWGCNGNPNVNIVIISALLLIACSIICCMSVFRKQYIYSPIPNNQNESERKTKN